MKPINKISILFDTDYSVMHFLLHCLNFRKIFNISQYEKEKTDENVIQKELVVNDTYYYRNQEEYKKVMYAGAGRKTNTCLAKLYRDCMWKNMNLYVSIVPNVYSLRDQEIKRTYKYLAPMEEDVDSYDGYIVNISRHPTSGGETSVTSLNSYYVEKIKKYIGENKIRNYTIVERGK